MEDDLSQDAIEPEAVEEEPAEREVAAGPSSDTSFDVIDPLDLPSDDDDDDPDDDPGGHAARSFSPEELALVGAESLVDAVAPSESTTALTTTPRVESIAFSELPRVQGPIEEVADISLLMDVPLEITVELGQATRTIRELLEIGRGSILHLTRHAGEPVDVLVNGQRIAKGEVVVIDENFGIRVTEVVSPAERLRTMAA